MYPIDRHENDEKPWQGRSEHGFVNALALPGHLYLLAEHVHKLEASLEFLSPDTTLCHFVFYDLWLLTIFAMDGMPSYPVTI